MGGKGGITLKVPRDLTRFEAEISNLADFPFIKLNKNIANAIRNSTLQRFQDEKDPEGEPWQPSERAELNGDKTLSDTARLKNSITTAASVDEAEVGTNTVYARIHQLGGEAGKRNGTMPKRSYLGLSKEDEELVGKMIKAQIKRHLKSKGYK